MLVAKRCNLGAVENTKRKTARPDARTVEKTALPEISKLIKTFVRRKYLSACAKINTHTERSKITDAGSPNTQS